MKIEEVFVSYLITGIGLSMLGMFFKSNDVFYIGFWAAVVGAAGLGGFLAGGRN